MEMSVKTLVRHAFTLNLSTFHLLPAHTCIGTFLGTTTHFLFAGRVDLNFWGNVGDVEVHAAHDEETAEKDQNYRAGFAEFLAQG